MSQHPLASLLSGIRLALALAAILLVSWLAAPTAKAEDQPSLGTIVGDTLLWCEANQDPNHCFLVRAPGAAAVMQICANAQDFGVPEGLVAVPILDPKKRGLALWYLIDKDCPGFVEGTAL